jgi:uroporphyrinogen-III synthase
MTDTPLAGCRVLITRAADQAESLCDAIVAAGGTAIRFPVIRIAPRPADKIAAEFAALPTADIAIFVSANAVAYGADIVSAGTTKIGAVGRTTSRALADRGIAVTIDPGEGFTSEQLLGHGDLQDLAGKSVLIVRGADGRRLLGKALAGRGAKINYLHVYTREPAEIPAAEVKQLDDDWQSNGLDAVSVMSVATFEALVGILPASALLLLRKTPLVAPGERMIQTIGKLVPGIPAIQAAGPHPDDIVSALIKWRNSGTNQ